MTDSNRGNGPGRDARGRFAKGNSGGPGNPRLRRLAEHRAAIAAAVSREDLVEVFQELHARALKGDTQAARLLIEYAVGKPSPALEIVDQGALELPADLGTAEGLKAASEAVVRAVVAGRIPVDTGTKLGALLEGVRNGALASDIEAILGELEEREKGNR